MRVTDCLGYLVGHRPAIDRLARSRAALPTGIILVLFTAFARNYDQTFIGENPFLWLAGSLMFSVVSGSWLYLITYKLFSKRPAEEGGAPSGAKGWPTFMGLFWMTAPIAWLYALPVERWLDSLEATKANLALLGVVSAWRVILFARVLQVATRAAFWVTLIWVLFGAAVEILAVFFFGGHFARAIMNSMGGMRNSPEEELILKAMNSAFTVALFAAPAALLAGLILKGYRNLHRLPEPQPDRVPWRLLGVAAAFWLLVTIVPQRELANNTRVEKQVATGHYRQALDFLNARTRDDFAPSRVLPPKPYEHDFFDELPGCLAAVQENDSPWVREFLVRRLDQMIGHYSPPWRGQRVSSAGEERIEEMMDGIRWTRSSPTNFVNLLSGLKRFPEGRGWLKTNELFLEALRRSVQTNIDGMGRESQPDPARLSQWLAVSNQLQQRLY